MEGVTASRNPLLDCIRGFAVLQVFWWHVVQPYVSRYSIALAGAMNLTWSGVDLFFVLSGFLLGGILIRNRESQNFYSTFYVRRFLRILPLYWICLALYFIIERPNESIFPYLTLTQNFRWAFQSVWGPGFITPTWSLAVEEQFYLILPLLIRLCPPRKLPWILISLIAAAPLCRSAFMAAHYPYAAYILLPCRMDALFAGVLLAWATNSADVRNFLHQKRAQVGAMAIAAVSGALLIGALILRIDALDPKMAIFGYSAITIFYTACLTLLLSWGARMPKALTPMAWCGLGAYSIYLFHIPLQLGAFQLLGHKPIAVVAMLAGISVIAYVCWQVVEKPLIAWGHAHFRYGKPNSLPAIKKGI